MSTSTIQTSNGTQWKAYGQSKSANALSAIALDRRGQRHGVRAFAVHPGRILTDLARYLKEDELAAGQQVDIQMLNKERPPVCGAQRGYNWREKAAYSA